MQMICKKDLGGIKVAAMTEKAHGLIPAAGCGIEFIVECSTRGRVELHARALPGKGLWTI